jgi:cyanophycinase
MQLQRLLPGLVLSLGLQGANAGTAIVIGGALRSDNATVWQRVVQEAGGPGARIAVFATAAANPERASQLIITALEREGAVARFVPVAPRLAGIDLATQLADPAVIEQVRTSQGVFFSGGAQELIVDTLQPGGESTEMLRAIREVFDRGGVVAGTSAGAAIMSRMMFRDAQDNLGILRGHWRLGKEYDRGLGFVGPDLFIDQHFLKRGRIGRILPAMQRLGYGLGLGVEENSAAVVKDRQIEVIGARGALLVDLREARSDARQPHFNVQGVRLSYLDSGDRYDLGTHTATPAAHKLREHRIDPAASDYKPYLPRGHFFGDILGDGAIVAAMAQLLDSPAIEVRGLAYEPPTAARNRSARLGFEFRLYKAPGLTGWFSGALGGEDYTVLNARLDVMPVTMAHPLYVPLAPSSASAPTHRP